MLFSNADVSAFINQHFEPAWEMVRPVPIVRIDFGNGNVATRTLHGNIASYVCEADGQLVDIVPGIYTPTAYTTALAQPRDLARALGQLPAEQRVQRLQNHHRDKAQALRVATRLRQEVNIQGRELDRGKGSIELAVERVITTGRQNATRAVEANPRRPRTAAELAGWQPLADDTLINETQRRLLIHDRLAGADRLRPEQIKRWLYRDVLHADLDDPNLGLGDDFFADIERPS